MESIRICWSYLFHLIVSVQVSKDFATAASVASSARSDLSIRLPDGRVLKRSFAGDALLMEVVEYVAEHVQPEHAVFTLTTRYPFRTFTSGEYSSLTLAQAGTICSF